MAGIIAFLVGAFVGGVFVGGYAYLQGFGDGEAKAVREVREEARRLAGIYRVAPNPPPEPPPPAPTYEEVERGGW